MEEGCLVGRVLPRAPLARCWSSAWMGPGSAHWCDQIDSSQLLSTSSAPHRDPSTW